MLTPAAIKRGRDEEKEKETESEREREREREREKFVTNLQCKDLQILISK